MHSSFRGCRGHGAHGSGVHLVQQRVHALEEVGAGTQAHDVGRSKSIGVGLFANGERRCAWGERGLRMFQLSHTVWARGAGRRGALRHSFGGRRRHTR